MKPITSKVKKSVSPLKQTTDDKKITGKGKGEQGQLQEYSVTGEPGTTIFQPATRRVEKLAKTPEEIKKWKNAIAKNPNLEADLGYKGKNISTSGNINVEISEPKTQASEGTVSDVYRTFDQRKYGAGGRIEKVAARQERKAGRQEERRLNRASRKGVIDKKSQEFKDQLMSAKKKRYGQGAVAQEARKQMESPEQATIQREQVTQKKTPRLSTYTRNFEVPTKASRGGESIMAPESMESTTDQISKAKESILSGSGDAVRKRKDIFSNLQKFDENEGVGKMKSSAIKMTKGASPFKMKGYGKKGC
jgi:hypothetical protein